MSDAEKTKKDELSAVIYIPGENSILIARKGSFDDLDEEDRKNGFKDAVRVACHRYFNNESEEIYTVFIPIKESFSKSFPKGSEEKLAKLAVTSVIGDVPFSLIKE